MPCSQKEACEELIPISLCNGCRSNDATLLKLTAKTHYYWQLGAGKPRTLIRRRQDRLYCGCVVKTEASPTKRRHRTGRCEVQEIPNGNSWRWAVRVPESFAAASETNQLKANTGIDDDRVRALLLAERRTLEMIVGGAALNDILEELCRSIDAQQPDVITTVLLMDPDGKRLWPAAGPRVPIGWTKVITPLQIGPDVGSCGTAAFLKAGCDRLRHRDRSIIRSRRLSKPRARSRIACRLVPTAHH